MVTEQELQGQEEQGLIGNGMAEAEGVFSVVVSNFATMEQEKTELFEEIGDETAGYSYLEDITGKKPGDTLLVQVCGLQSTIDTLRERDNFTYIKS